jgi:hypothetical protein
MKPQTTFEQRHELYNDVEDLISPGFISAPVQLGKTQLVLRSLCGADRFLLRQRAAYASPEDFQLWWLAQSIWMIDGVNLFQSGRDNVPDLMPLLRQLPRQALSILTTQINGFFKRSRKALNAVIPYTLERISRELWSAMGTTKFNAGVADPSVLGMNDVQKLWITVNQLEDKSEKEELEWLRFRFVAMTNAPKWVKGHIERDNTRRETEQKARLALLDEFYWTSKGAPPSKTVKLAATHSNKSEEDLREEVHRWIRGELDDHDRMVLAYKDGMRQQHEDRLREIEEARSSYYDEQDLEAEVRGQETGGLVAYLPSQIEELVSSLGNRKVFYDNPYNEKVARKAANFDRPPEQLLTEVQEQYGVSRGKGSLQEQISQRRIHLTDRED